MTSTAPTSDAQQLAWVDIFDAPTHTSPAVIADPELSPVERLDPAAIADLTVAETELLAAIHDRVDEDTCGNLGCTQPVGWVLREDADHPQRAGLVWFPIALIQHSQRGLIAVCEDCSPSSVYQPPLAI